MYQQFCGVMKQGAGERMRRGRTLLVAAVITAGSLAGASSAAAQDQNPPGCSASQLHLDIDQTPSLVRMGDVIRYMLYLDNIGPNACQVDNVNVSLQVPGRSGAPVAVGEVKYSFPHVAAQFPRFPMGPYSWTVDVDPGVK